MAASVRVAGFLILAVIVFDRYVTHDSIRLATAEDLDSFAFFIPERQRGGWFNAR